MEKKVSLKMMCMADPRAAMRLRRTASELKENAPADVSLPANPMRMKGCLSWDLPDSEEIHPFKSSARSSSASDSTATAFLNVVILSANEKFPGNGRIAVHALVSSEWGVNQDEPYTKRKASAASKQSESILVPLRVKKTVPESASVHLFFRLSVYNADRTAPVYSLWARAMVSIRDLTSTPITVPMIHYTEQFEVGKALISLAGKPGYRLTEGKERKISSLDTAPFEEYNRAVFAAIAEYDIGDARFPSGHRFTWNKCAPFEASEVLGKIPHFHFLRNRQYTAIDKTTCDEFVNNMIRVWMIVEGITVAGYEKMIQTKPGVLYVLSRLGRFLPSLIAHTEDSEDSDIWSIPYTEPDLQHASVDCEELAQMSAHIIRHLANCSPGNAWVAPLNAELERMVGVYLMVTTRGGSPVPANIRATEDVVHLIYALVPTAYLDFLESRFSGKSEKVPEVGGSAVIVFECLADVQSSSLVPEARNLGKEEVLVVPSRLKRYIPFETGKKDKFVGDVIAMFVIGRDSFSRQLVPITIAKGKRSLGFSFYDFVDMKQLNKMAALRLPAPSRASMQLADVYRNEMQRYNCMTFDAKCAAHITNELVDRIVSESTRSGLCARAFLTMYDDKEMKPDTLESVVQSAVQTIHSQAGRLSYGKKAMLTESVANRYRSVKAHILQTAQFYLTDALTDKLRCVVLCYDNGAGAAEAAAAEAPAGTGPARRLSGAARASAWR